MKKQFLVTLCSLCFLAVEVQPLQAKVRLGKAGPEEQADIANEVRHELVMLPSYSLFDSLTYMVQGRTVILGGMVTRPIVKTEAEAAVKGIRGVEKIVSTSIQVLPASITDDRIRMAEAQAIFDSENGLPRYGWQKVPSIHILVNAGTVTLAGWVQLEEDKSQAETLAKTVPGVSGVKNELKVVEDDSREAQ